MPALKVPNRRTNCAAIGDDFGTPKVGRGAAFGDFDLDGDLDIVVATNGAPLGPGLGHGIMVAMNSKARNFLVFRWQDVAGTIKPPLRMNAAR